MKRTHPASRLILAFLAVLASRPLSAQKVHAILACDDADAVLGKASAQDFRKMQSFSGFVAESLGYALEVHQFRGKNFAKDRLAAKLESLNPATEDVVIFYYSGTGFRMPGRASWAPFLLFPGNQRVDSEELFGMLSTKTPGTLLFMLEAGNEEHSEGTARLLAKSTPSPKAMANVKKLFVQRKYYVFQAAASPGEPSLAYDEGSAMTTVFHETFMRALEDQDPTWEGILEEVSETVSVETASQQSPKFFALDHTPVVAAAANTALPQPIETAAEAALEEPLPPPPVKQETLGDASTAHAGKILSNERLHPDVFLFEGGALFEGSPNSWFLVFDAESEPIALRRVALERQRIVLRAPNGGIVMVSPLGIGATLSMKKPNESTYKPLFSGDWKRKVVRYAF